MKKGKKASTGKIKLDKRALRRDSLEPLDRLSMARRYFRAVKVMDRGALKGRTSGVDQILKLWNEDGVLQLRGPEPIGNRTYKGYKDLAKFYKRRTKGLASELGFNLSNVQSAKAGETGLTVGGKRLVISSKGEGIEVPFSHTFQTNKRGEITSLRIQVGKAKATELAPQGSLQIEDMGRLAAMAWMVA